MIWWMYLIIGGIAAICIFILFISLRSRKKPKKQKAPTVKEDKPEPIKESNDGIIYEENMPIQEKSEQIIKDDRFDEAEFEAEMDKQLEEDYDEEDERRYREFMARHNFDDRNPNKSYKENDEDDFDKFRREHCYSKYMTDKELAKSLINVPEDVKKIIFNDLFNKIKIEDFDNKF